MEHHLFREIRVRFSPEYFNREYGEYNQMNMDEPYKIFSFSSEIYDGRNNLYALMAFDSPLHILDMTYMKENDLRYYLDEPKDMLKSLLYENASGVCLVHYIPFSSFENYRLVDGLYTDRLKEFCSPLHMRYLDTIQVDAQRTYFSFSKQHDNSYSSSKTAESVDYAVDEKPQIKDYQKAYKKNIRVIRSGGIKYAGVNDTLEDAINIMGKEMAMYNRETVCVLNIDNDGKPKHFSYISMGGIDASVIDERIVFQQALLTDTERIVLIHNHPSGDIAPSAADIMVTKKLSDIGKMLGVQLLDSVIVGGGYNSSSTFCSLREECSDLFSEDYKPEYRKSRLSNVEGNVSDLLSDNYISEFF